MKNYSNYRGFLWGLVGLLLFAGCTAEKVEDIGAQDLRSSARTIGQVLTFKGIVYNAMEHSLCYNDTYAERLMIDAEVSLPDYGISTRTDEYGVYTLKLPMERFTEVHGKNALFEDIKMLVTVDYEGYVSSSLTYDYAAFYEGELGTGYMSNVIEIDFPLTDREEMQLLTPDGGTFIFGDYTVTVPSGAVTEDTPFALTRIAHEQVRGFTNRRIEYGVRETELERFELHPASLELAHPASISFSAVDAFKLQQQDQVVVTTLIADNLWYEDKNDHYKQDDLITFETTRGNTYRIHALYADHNCKILDDVRFIHPYGTGEKMSNCDCGVATSMDIISKKVKRESIEFENDVSDELARRILRQIRKTANIPGVSKNCTSDNRRFSFYSKSCAASMAMDQCEAGDMSVDQRMRLLRGNIFGQNFEYKYRYTFDTEMKRSKCATTTACHQGC